MKRMRKQALTLFASAIGGGLVGAGLVKVTGGAASAVVPGPGVLGVALVLYLLCVVAHEAGHVAAGAFAGFRPLLLVAGPLRIEWTSGRTRVRLNRSLALAGGLALCAPVGVHDLRRRTMVLVAGGPIASLMLGAQCLAVWSVLSPMFDDRAGFGAMAMFALLLGGVISVAVGLITLVPMRAGGFYSDGARLLRLMRNDEETAREVALLALMGLMLGGTRPRDWRAELVRSAVSIRDDGPFEASALQFAHIHALDTGDIEAARSYLEETLVRVERLPAAARAALHRAAAVFFALYDGDAARARGCLEASGPGTSLMEAPHERLLAEAAVLLAEGDRAGAGRAATAAQELLERSGDVGSTALDAAHIERILSAAVAAP